jgi:hypothetical protein
VSSQAPPASGPAGIDFARLARPEAWPGDPSAAGGVSWVQTHLSHVFLTRERVYKFRKAVDLGFVCFLDREERNADCLREVRLNRRLAPDVYLGVAPLRAGPGGPSVGEPAEALAGAAEHCVVMRRLPEGRDALSLLERGRLEAGQVERVAERIARFHAEHGLGTPAPFSPEEWLERVSAPVRANFESMAGAPAAAPGEAVATLRGLSERFLAERAPALEARRRAGRAVDGHGDLHLQHVWFAGDALDPRVIDCLEFDERLRHVDAASDVAFLAMDLAYRGAARLGERFLRRYAREADDFDLYAVVDFFASYRAAVRAKVAAIAAGDPGIGSAQRERAAASAQRHLALGISLLEPRPRAPLVLVGGTVGRGKSTLAEALAEEVGGVVVSSDRVRKRLAGLPATERRAGDWREGLYAPAMTERVYAALLERAAPVLEAGRVAILDATWARAAHRAAARRLAAERGVPARLLAARCAPGVALERLARRAAEGRDASDAGPELLAASVRSFEPLADWPEAERAELHTDRAGWRDALAGVAAGLGLPRAG